MSLIRLPAVFSVPFMRWRYLPWILWLSMLLIMISGIAVRGIHWGVDFRGGFLIEARLSRAPDMNTLRKNLRSHIGQEFILQEVGKNTQTILIRTEPTEHPTHLLSELKTVLGQDVVYRRTESIGPKVGQELITNGLYAIAMALFGIMLYVWIRFEWQFSVCAFVALLHDCMGLLAFLTWMGIELNESVMVALLITAAYSVNDTVVIFDRLRENMNKSYKTFVDVLNLSLNETLGRTLLTSSTALLALWMMYLFGGEVISAFSLPILVGIFIGAYSSVVIAVPLLRWLPIPKSAAISVSETERSHDAAHVPLESSSTKKPPRPANR